MSWRRRKQAISGVVSAALVLAAPASGAAQAGRPTPAGTIIGTTAQARHDAGAATAEAPLVVAELLEVTLEHVGVDAGGVIVTVTNRGNGQEAFQVTATLHEGGGDGAALPIATESDNVVRERTPVMASGGSLRLRVPIERAASAAAASLVVTATALTGSGATGTPFEQQGDGGGDAVVGPTGATARLAVPLGGLAWQPPTIAIAQSVEAPDGSPVPMRGAVITYTIDASFTAATPRGELVDAVPAGASYRPGTLRLDGAPVADAGRVADGRVTVPLGAVAAGATHRLTFQVVIS